ncbi:hypothetical protein P4118_14105 [Pseudomonas aeruginosa]|nr:hypothetical protein [Pseudomonas aeruginosa]
MPNQPSEQHNFRPELHDSAACRSMPATASGCGVR